MKKNIKLNLKQRKNKSKDFRINIIQDFRKGRLILKDFISFLKYDLSSERAYILKKLSENQKSAVYGLPKVSSTSNIASGTIVYSHTPSIQEELVWSFEILTEYSQTISSYLVRKEKIERELLLGNYYDCLDLLDELEQITGSSIYITHTEFYINAKLGQSHVNSELISEFAEEGANGKLLLILEYIRLQVDNKISPWQYNLLLEQFKQLYNNEIESYKEYINYKFDSAFINDYDINEFAFILYLESNLAITDRYESLKKLLGFVILNNLEEDVKSIIVKNGYLLYNKTNDIYWRNLLLYLGEFVPVSYSERDKSFLLIQDLFLSENYENVLEKSLKILRRNPQYSELYLIFIKSAIILNKNIDDDFETQSEITNILKSIKAILEKNLSYHSEKESIIKKTLEAQHLSFSNTLLEFIQYESNLEAPLIVKLLSFLNCPVLRYNAVNNIKSNEIKEKIFYELHNIHTYKLLAGLYHQKELRSFSSPLEYQIAISFFINNKMYKEALNLLNIFVNSSITNKAFEFVGTWLVKHFLICFYNLEMFADAAHLVVKYYFDSKEVYDHFFHRELLEGIVDLEMDDLVYTNISVPIIFQLFKQPQALVYDAIANFLVANEVMIPSHLIKSSTSFEQKRLIYFFEHVCILENIDSSPFLNSIEALEAERISLLNFFKRGSSRKYYKIQ